MMNETIAQYSRLVAEGKRITNEHNKQFAMSLISAGFKISPCGLLEDNHILVSRNVFESIWKTQGDK